MCFIFATNLFFELEEHAEIQEGFEHRNFFRDLREKPKIFTDLLFIKFISLITISF